MASQTFAHDIYLTVQGGKFYVGASLGGGVYDYGPVTVTDSPDANELNLAQLGDVNPDTFSVSTNDPGSIATFIGSTQNGFIGRLSSAGIDSYYLYTDFTYTADQAVGNLGTPYNLVCFTTGALISTARGDVAVEDLRVGDIALTSSGGRNAIRWIGHRNVDCGTHPVPSEVHPVRILAGAFGGGLPQRDLYLSPGHPVLVGGGEREVLVPIMCLINGTSIARAPLERVTYWHVELEQHDILLAEGLPAESFLDFGNRPWFENGADHALASPDFIPPGLDGRCRPVAIEGPIVEAERRRLDALFEMRLAAHCAWPSHEGAWAEV